MIKVDRELRQAKLHTRVWGSITYQIGSYTITDNVEMKLHRTIAYKEPADDTQKEDKNTTGS